MAPGRTARSIILDTYGPSFALAPEAAPRRPRRERVWAFVEGVDCGEVWGRSAATAAANLHG